MKCLKSPDEFCKMKATQSKYKKHARVCLSTINYLKKKSVLKGIKYLGINGTETKTCIISNKRSLEKNKYLTKWEDRPCLQIGRVNSIKGHCIPCVDLHTYYNSYQKMCHSCMGKVTLKLTRKFKTLY